MERSRGGHALLKISYACNNRCLFCHTADHRQIPAPTKQATLRKALAAKNLGATMIVLSGGEPTIRKDFFAILDGLAALGLEIGLCTNGRLLAYPEFAERFLSYRPGYLYVSLHGADEQTHDRLVRARAFGQTLRGLENVRGRCPEITVNVVIHNENFTGLGDLVETLAPLAPLRVKFSLIEPKGAALVEGRFLAPDVSEAASRVMIALRDGEQRHAGAGLAFRVDGFPPCLIPEYDRLNANLETDGILYMSEAFEDGFFPVDEGRRARHADCERCGRRESCPGIYEAYLAGYGRFLPKPFAQTLPNSFAYTRTGDAFRVLAGDCPVAPRVLTGLSTARDVMLLERGRLRVFHTDTRDFSDAKIKEIKFQLGQIYEEKGSGPPAGFHFRHHLRRLGPAAACRSCRRRPECPTLFHRLADNGFSKCETLLRQILRRLRGRVIDVGCGEPFYTDLWIRKTQRKEIDYLGIDPHPPSATLGLKFRACTIEGFEPEPGKIDAFVALRSYNHFRGLAEALEIMTRGLRPGGDLILADNIAFGLVRTGGLPPKTAFEHYRNHTSHEALAALREFPLRVVRHLPVTAATGNQWLIHAIKM